MMPSMIRLNRLDRCGPHRVGCSEAMEHRKAKMVAIPSGHDHVKRCRSRTDVLSTFVWFAAQIYTLYWCSARLAPARIEVTGSQCAIDARAGASDAVSLAADYCHPHFNPLRTTRTQRGDHSHHTNVSIMPAMLVRPSRPCHPRTLREVPEQAPAPAVHLQDKIEAEAEQTQQEVWHTWRRQPLV